MVRDGIFYGAGLLLATALVAYFTSPWWAVIPFLLAVFFMWFFRDPERTIPAESNAIVSPADGKVTHILPLDGEKPARTLISIFLNVFDVHVNRSPIAGMIRNVEYKAGCFGNAMDAACSERNEQNIVTVEGENTTITFKQIAGLLARRIVFTKKAGQQVARGERVGMIKFGSRVDVILPAGVRLAVRIGDHVKGGSSILGHLQPATAQKEP